MRKISILVIIATILLSSCKIMYPGLMFQQKDYQVFELKDKLIEEYIIKSGDELSVDFYTRDGQSLIERHINNSGSSNGLSQSSSTINSNKYIVKPNGYVSLPIIGDFYVQGYTSNTLKKAIESELSRLYIDPFVIINVNNRRVFLFKGYAGAVINLNQTPTHLIEVLALSGGIDKDLKAFKIKIIRGDLKSPVIYNVDLSTISGLITSDIVLQSNDIIYIEPKKKVFTETVRDITTALSLITSVFTTVFLLNKFKN